MTTKFVKQHYPDIGKGLVSLCVVSNNDDVSDTSQTTQEISKDFPELDTNFCEVNINQEADTLVVTFCMYTCMVPSSYEKRAGQPDFLINRPYLRVPDVEMPESLRSS